MFYNLNNSADELVEAASSINNTVLGLTKGEEEQAEGCQSQNYWI